MGLAWGREEIGIPLKIGTDDAPAVDAASGYTRNDF